MTLVVSEVTKHGIVMVGDSAITFDYGTLQHVKSGALKIQYSRAANIGFAVWGNAQVLGRQIDLWLNDFVDCIEEKAPLDRVASRLVTSITVELEQENKPWKDLVFGIHIAGYINDLPRLWHIHCGHSNEPPHEPRLYHDFPEDKKWSEEAC